MIWKNSLLSLMEFLKFNFNVLDSHDQRTEIIQCTRLIKKGSIIFGIHDCGTRFQYIRQTLNVTDDCMSFPGAGGPTSCHTLSLKKCLRLTAILLAELKCPSIYLSPRI